MQRQPDNNMTSFIEFVFFVLLFVLLILLSVIVFPLFVIFLAIGLIPFTTNVYHGNGTKTVTTYRSFKKIGVETIPAPNRN
jgi:NADH:ubiquinone oxidoreductase subunit 3 (subunit A)